MYFITKVGLGLGGVHWRMDVKVIYSLRRGKIELFSVRTPTEGGKLGPDGQPVVVELLPILPQEVIDRLKRQARRGLNECATEERV